MNAIIGFCHFCEAHGPRPVFCTFTTDDENHTKESLKSQVECSGCTSIGAETVIISKDECGTIFCSKESVPNTDTTALLRQAALRSITCEVSWSKDGGVVYFSETQGHVLSLMFPLKDTRARGLKRMFSVVVLMKDKMFLLNVTPILSEHMQKIAKELQLLADLVYNNEQSIYSQRALRLNTGNNDYGQSRSLVQLTGKEDIFKRLHTHFTWMLKIGSLTYSETLYKSKDLLNKLNQQNTKGSIFDDSCSVSYDECLTLRELGELMDQSDFRLLLYCTLTGVDIKINLNTQNPSQVVQTLLRLLPKSHKKSPSIYVSNEQDSMQINKCIVEEVKTKIYKCTWDGTLPTKYPTLMNRILNALSNDKFTDGILHQHIKSLQLEWLGIARTLKSSMQASSKNSDAVKKLKIVLGIGQFDEALVNYWMQFL